MDLISASIISILFLTIFIIAELLRKFAKISTEVTRKFVHFTGAATTIIFPFIFSSQWTVLLLAIGFGLIMFISKKLHWLQSVHDIERSSEGAIYHPIAIYLCFVFAQMLHQPYFYVISILILAISDASAALIGRTYGVRSFITEDENKKTFEGSIIFFLTAFLITHLILLLCTQTGRIESVLIAILISLIVTIFEGVSLEGTDNIFVPIGTMFILSKNINPTPEVILKHIIMLILIIISYLIILKPYKKIGFSGIILMGLMTYVAWALVGNVYAIALLLVALICQKTDWVFVKDDSTYKMYRVVPVFYVLAVPLIWIFASDICSSFFNKSIATIFFIPFISGLISQMSILRGWKRKIEKSVPTSRKCTIIKSTIFTLICLPLFFAIYKQIPVVAILSCIIASYITDRVYWVFVNKHENTWQQIEFLRVGLWATLITSTAVLLINLGV